ncbi:RluA family pseudouridine synthase [Peribacillus sp. NJ4]|uniref:RluA family pseudouridine synthase n=1 Tax=unclassified Peribacillus TaxID=2675266 RepID=UPI0025A2DD81|nr:MULTISPECIES: RluA family pseudouridine synthase [unclassified Peribacillus]MDM5213736.1 RluA family pseudouridine synthase [Peribacillus sp. NJ4]MDM5224113.1 RluA family pseudouridine synthase [Peribacillus sp. NJ11]
MSNQNFSLTWSVFEEDSGSLLREFLSKCDISKRALTDIKFKGGFIQLNGVEVTVRERIETGDTVTVIFPPEQGSEGLLPEPIPLNVRYEDEFVLVVAKPPSMNTIPSREHPNGSLANGLAGYYRKTGIQATIHIVTRLDRDTSGLVLIAKHRHIHHLLSEQQKSGQVKRRYQAIAEGTVDGPEGEIVAPIGRKSTSIIEREVREDGRYARTLFKVLAHTGSHTFLNLELQTGRTHQIRVHMAHIGHPLAGDDLYGGSRSSIPRQALHCFELKFLHPFTKKMMLFQEELPEDMTRLLEGSKGWDS